METDIFSEALDHFKRLIQFDTTNPPGNEREAIQYIADVLKRQNLEPIILESAEKRANLVVKLRGDGSAKPLHISSHIDVVGHEPQHWKYPPFSGLEAEGCIWGRGAIDMKNMTAYCLSTLLQLKREKMKLKRDIIMSVVADEETGGHFGMGWLSTKHSELIMSEYYLGEVGGYSTYFSGRRIYPIQVGEKGSYWINVNFSSTPGHGSIPNPNNVHYKLSKFLTKLNSRPLPAHQTASTKAFLLSLSSALGPINGMQFKVLQSDLGPLILKKMATQSLQPEKFLAIGAMLTNTANPTGVTSGMQHNVVPSQLTLKLDCRILPGFSPEDLIREIETLCGEKLDYTVVSECQGFESTFETPLFKEICKQITTADSEAIPVPALTVGSTDAHYLNKLGVICYGFTPIKFSEDLNFASLFHGHNERIPIEGFRWGLNVFSNTIKDFCGTL
jgi:acetylornithine deacetylase/succinyl-diaminopimelate desuccinylase-like protein